MRKWRFPRRQLSKNEEMEVDVQLAVLTEFTKNIVEKECDLA